MSLNWETPYRGKRKDSKEWVYGFWSYEPWGKTHYISSWYFGSYAELARYEVIPESVGRNTSLFDLNGTNIFEGDIVKEGCNGLCAAVYFDENKGSYRLKCLGDSYKAEDSRYEWEVIGNTYDSPELLQVKE